MVVDDPVLFLLGLVMKTKAAMPVLSFLLASIGLFLGAGIAVAQSAPEGRAREVLSVGWQAGYCAVRPKSRGCTDFSAGAPAAARFSLVNRFEIHKSYCGIEAGLQEKARKGKWIDLPDITLAAATKERLEAAMPAVRVGLDRRQWLKSGSCLAPSAEAYYARSLDLLDELNASPVRTLFSERKGSAITLAEIRAAFDAAFGKGAGERVRLACRKAGDRVIVTGFTIGLAAGEGTFAALISGASPTKSRCTGGMTGAGAAE